MYYFCTYFDRNFLSRGLALYSSLQRLGLRFKLWILCLDTTTHDILSACACPEIELIPLEDFEKANPALLAVKPHRSKVEYYWTCGPTLILHVLRHHSEIDILTYLDADLFFFADPKPAYDELGDNSIYLVGHRFGPADQVTGIPDAGHYNVGYMMFRNDSEALPCLQWWADRCVAWCYNRIEDGKLGDQKYLDEFPNRCRRVTETRLLGVGLGGWNFFHYSFTRRNGMLRVNDEPMIVFHFNCVEIVNSHLFKASGGWRWGELFRPYARALRQEILRISGVAPTFDAGWTHFPWYSWPVNLANGSLIFVP